MTESSYDIRDEVKKAVYDLDIALCLSNHLPDAAVQMAAAEVVLSTRRLAVKLGFDLEAAINAQEIKPLPFSKENGIGWDER